MTSYGLHEWLLPLPGFPGSKQVYPDGLKLPSEGLLSYPLLQLPYTFLEIRKGHEMICLYHEFFQIQIPDRCGN